MTEKRFEVIINEFDEVEYIMDKEMMEDRDFADFMDFVEDVCKENEQLKQQVNEWQKSTAHWSKQHSELEKSHERLLKMLDNVANYMQKENKYMPIDDFVEWWNAIATKGLDGDVE